MDQTSIIAAALIVAFIVFITVRGELPGYLSVFTGSAVAPAGTSASSTAANVGATVGNKLLGNNDPVQYPGGIPMPAPWGGTDFYGGLFGGGPTSGGIGNPPATVHPL